VNERVRETTCGNVVVVGVMMLSQTSNYFVRKRMHPIDIEFLYKSTLIIRHTRYGSKTKIKFQAIDFNDRLVKRKTK